MYDPNMVIIMPAGVLTPIYFPLGKERIFAYFYFVYPSNDIIAWFWLLSCFIIMIFNIVFFSDKYIL